MPEQINNAVNAVNAVHTKNAPEDSQHGAALLQELERAHVTQGERQDKRRNTQGADM